jgi:uncharacterized membrane-anchored protein
MEIRVTQNYEISKLQHWLDYGLSSSALFFLSYAYGFTLILAFFAAIALLPLLLKVLIKERRYGWLIFFFISVAGPALVTYYLLDHVAWIYSGTNIFTTVSVALVLFYFYCGLLRLTIPQWHYSVEEEVY